MSHVVQQEGMGVRSFSQPNQGATSRGDGKAQFSRLLARSTCASATIFISAVRSDEFLFRA